MAILPQGAQELELEDALRYFKSWTQADRDLVRRLLIERFGTLASPPEGVDTDEAFFYEDLQWYAPPSGGYVAGHRGKSQINLVETGWKMFHPLRSSETNEVYLNSGFITFRIPGEPVEEIRLSGFREVERESAQSSERDNPICGTCFLTHAGECP